MRIHCLQHVPFEGPAAIGDWAHERGHKLTITRLDRGQHLPAIGAFDWLIVLGGPMGVADRQRHAWMSPEIELIAGAVDAGRRVLGICLGAQLLAHALGARVYPAVIVDCQARCRRIRPVLHAVLDRLASRSGTGE